MIRLDDPDFLGPALKLMRQTTGLSQQAAAKAASSSQSHVNDWEQGARRPSVAGLIRLADALGYDLALIPRAETGGDA
jgi:transcriptional regulator with XRE-family HTH domain